MVIEEEIKLRAAAASVLDAVASDDRVLACAQGGLSASCRLHATYHDTPDRRLLHHRLAFRVRQEGAGVWRAGLKGMGGVVDGVSRRMEWEVPLAAPLERLDDLPPGELREKMVAIVGLGASLEPLMVTDFNRRTVVLYVAETQVEMALDQGEVRASGGGVQPLFEVELERLEGGLAPLQAFAAVLSRRHGLTPSPWSKFGLGLSLLGLPKESWI